MTELPQGWAATQFGDLFDFKGGSQPPKETFFVEPAADRVRLLQIRDFGSDDKAVYIKDAPKWPKCSETDIMVGRYGASVGKILTGKAGAYNVALIRWIFDDQKLEREWVKRLLQSDIFQVPLQKISRSAQNGFNKEDIAGLPLALPPLPEQRRIVRKLDTLSARSTSAQTHLTAIEKLVGRYRTAVLEAAFKSVWDAGCNATIAGCLEHAETGLVRSKAEQTQGEGYPYIRMNHYDLAGRWNDRDLTHVAATTSEFDRYQLRADDLLFNTRNSAELVGKVAIWPEGKGGYVFNNNLLRMRFSPDLVPAFAFWQMSSPPFRRYIEGFISATTSVAAIYQRSLMAAPFWVPDPDQQCEIVRRIETAFAKIDRLAAEAAKALKLLGHLDQRILANAFSGDLVPQDPTDEPAETLLARIREARAVAPKGKRGRRTSA